MLAARTASAGERRLRCVPPLLPRPGRHTRHRQLRPCIRAALCPAGAWTRRCAGACAGLRPKAQPRLPCQAGHCAANHLLRGSGTPAACAPATRARWLAGGGWRAAALGRPLAPTPTTAGAALRRPAHLPLPGSGHRSGWAGRIEARGPGAAGPAWHPPPPREYSLGGPSAAACTPTSSHIHHGACHTCRGGAAGAAGALARWAPPRPGRAAAARPPPPRPPPPAARAGRWPPAGGGTRLPRGGNCPRRLNVAPLPPPYPASLPAAALEPFANDGGPDFLNGPSYEWDETAERVRSMGAQRAGHRAGTGATACCPAPPLTPLPPAVAAPHHAQASRGTAPTPSRVSTKAAWC